MAVYLGAEYTRENLMRRLGSLSQIAGIEETVYSAGRMQGVKSLRIRAGEFELNVLPSRCLDIAQASYRGYPLGYLSKSGIRAPQYFSADSPRGFLDNFFGGLLTTCGLNNIGSSCEENGRTYPQHGELSNCPAEQISIEERWNGNQYQMRVSGCIRHSRFYAEDFLLRRSISVNLGENRFFLEDEIENQDFAPAPIMLLYHINLGFPFLSERAYLITSPILSTTPREGTSPGTQSQCTLFGAPEDGKTEECFYHQFQPDADGKVTVCLFNPDLGEHGLGIYIRYDPTEFPYFVQWKMLRSREYVCGFAPATAHLEGRAREAAQYGLPPLAPGESRRFRTEFGAVQSAEECRSMMH